MSLDRRLSSLEGSLGPRAAVLHWASEFLLASTTSEYVLLREAASPAWVELLRRTKSAAGKEVRGRPRGEVLQTERAAIQNVLFLCALMDRVNTEAVEQWDFRELCATFLGTMSMSLPLLVHFALESPEAETWWDRSINELTRTETLLEYTTERLLVPRLAVERVSQRFFGDHPILFAGARQLFTFDEQCIRLLRDTYELSAGWMERETIESHPHLEERVAEYARAYVDCARIDVLTTIGEHEAAHAIRARYRDMLQPQRAAL